MHGEVAVRLDDRDIRPDVRARDRWNDLVLLCLPAGNHAVAVFQDRRSLYPGGSDVAIGYPLCNILASEGRVSVGTASAPAGVGNSANHLKISNPIQQGNSGVEYEVRDAAAEVGPANVAGRRRTATVHIRYCA